MHEKEEIWQNNLRKYESAATNSLSGQFFCSKRLMKCMECFVKGDPEKFEAKRVDQIEQLKSEKEDLQDQVNQLKSEKVENTAIQLLIVKYKIVFGSQG